MEREKELQEAEYQSRNGSMETGGRECGSVEAERQKQHRKEPLLGEAGKKGKEETEAE